MIKLAGSVVNSLNSIIKWKRLVKRFNLNSKWWLAIYLGAWLVFWVYFWSQSLVLDQVGNLVAGHVSIWGDWAAHLTMTTSMAVRGPWLTSSPFLTGTKFSYPFFNNFISAILWRQGFSLIHSLIIPSFLESIFFIWIVQRCYLLWFRSRTVALLAATIFLLNGGVGFYYYWQDIQTSPTPWQTTINPPREYTSMEQEHLRWISIVNSMIIPQRAFLLGFPVTVALLVVIYSRILVGHSPSFPRKVWPMVAVGWGLGSLPIIHAHSFLAAFIILIGWCGGSLIQDLPNSVRWSELISWWSSPTGQRWRYKCYQWLILALTTILIATLIWRTFYWHNQIKGFIKWFPGWYLQEYRQDNWLIFWLRNWGLVPILASGGWLITWKRRRNWPIHPAWLFGPFFVLFGMANLWLWQPFIWDNTKLIVWASLGWSGLTAWLIVVIWKKISHFNWLKWLTWHFTLKSIVNQLITNLIKIILILIILLTIFSGTIDTWRIIRFPLHQYQMYSAEELELANWTRTQTATSSRWLTGDQHNHWLFNLTGRQALLTYRGWLWTHGYRYQVVEKDVGQMFNQPQLSLSKFTQYQVNYVVIGPNEQQVWRADPNQFDQLFKTVKQTTNYRIYQVN